MTICYLIPGLTGSSLATRAPDGSLDPLWVDPFRMARGHVFRLRLDRDGVSPSSQGGQECFPVAVIPAFYAPVTAALAFGLPSPPYTVATLPYDWRMDLHAAGAALAARIREEVNPGDPCALVGHSAGGLIARLAWWRLASTGQQGLIRRIVTLGSPHWGSYAAARIWGTDDDLVASIAYFLGPASALPLFECPADLRPLLVAGALATLCASWPSLYQTLPSTFEPDQTFDGDRGALYQPGSWPATRQVSAARLASALGDWQPLLAGPETLPPASVLTTVAGTGFPTRHRLGNAALLGAPDAIAGFADGDGTVTRSSALLGPARRYTVPASHFGMLYAQALLSRLPQWVVEEGPAPSPDAQPVALPGPTQAEPHEPPFPNFVPPPTRAGKCLEDSGCVC